MNCLSYNKYCVQYEQICSTIATGEKICYPSSKCSIYCEVCSKYEIKEECYQMPGSKCFNIPKLCEDGWSVGNYYCYKVATKVE